MALFSSWDWYLCNGRFCEEVQFVTFQDTPWLRTYLQNCKSDQVRMQNLRKLLEDGCVSQPIWLLTDDEIVDLIIHFANFGRIHVHARSLTTGDHPVSQASKPKPAAFPLSERGGNQSSGSRREQNEPDTFSNYGPDAQAAALAAAAASGAPFCPV